MLTLNYNIITLNHTDSNDVNYSNSISIIDYFTFYLFEWCISFLENQTNIGKKIFFFVRQD